MFAKPALLLSIIQAALLFSSIEARIRLVERDGRVIFARRFSQEQPAVLKEIAAACGGGVCDTLAGEAVTPLLAAQPECSQQDMADKIIDTSLQFDAATKEKMIAAAVKYRQAEKNTPPDFTTNPPSLRNSVFCQKAPKNSQLKGLVQAQDPANNPNLFFDPATGATVTLGSQPNTLPFGANDRVDPPMHANNTKVDGPANNTGNKASGNTAMGHNGKKPMDKAGDNVPNDAGNKNATAAGNIGNFGSCSVPQIEFGQGFDGRKETSFRPVDQKSFTHGSAQNIDVITQSMCDQLVNTCKADAVALKTCADAKAAASAATPVKTGIQADAFNAVFNITTNFATAPVFDDQGRVVSGNVDNGNNDKNATIPSNNGGNAGNNVTCTCTVNLGNNDNNGNNGNNNRNDTEKIGDFGSCSVPQIEFGAGFDNRRETSFRPVDLVSYNHGSAQNFDIIGQFVCDQLVNKCGADATARDTCAQARTAAGKAPAKTGKQADAFNAVFGNATDFASINPLDNQGRVITARRAFFRRHLMQLVEKYV